MLAIGGFTLKPRSVAAYSSNHNAFIGLTPNECSGMTNPQTTIGFSTQMYNTNGASGRQWTAQMNAYANPNTLHGDISFLQYAEGINNNGQIYGLVEYWNPHNTIVFYQGTGTLATVSDVQGGDNFYIETFTNNNHNVNLVKFYYYHSGTLYGPASVTVTSDSYVNIYSWQVNIVGDAVVSNAHFSPSEDGTIYYSMGSGTFMQMSNGPSCVQNCCAITGETSDLIYGTPSLSGNSGSQSFLSNP